MNKTVLFLGAGFSKASGLKTTSELGEGFLHLGPTRATPELKLQEQISTMLGKFWGIVFGWRLGRAHPSLEDHFTLLDLAANTGHNLGAYSPRMLRAIRRLSIHRVFDILDQGFEPSPAASELIARTAQTPGNAIITTNWDVAVDQYVTNVGSDYWYGMDAYYVNGKLVNRSGLPLLKLHGSGNWMYCDCCRRIYIGRPLGGKAALHSRTFLQPDDFVALGAPPVGKTLLRHRDHFKCAFCKIELTARVATFSFAKALGFFQFQAVWDRSLDVLRTAKRWVFIGYSLPQADFEIRSLLKAAELADSSGGRKQIIAVIGEDPIAARNYEQFFGSRARVYATNLESWWKSHKIA